jgi:hypothetical protein
MAFEFCSQKNDRVPVWTGTVPVPGTCITGTGVPLPGYTTGTGIC